MYSHVFKNYISSLSQVDISKHNERRSERTFKKALYTSSEFSTSPNNSLSLQSKNTKKGVCRESNPDLHQFLKSKGILQFPAGNPKEASYHWTTDPNCADSEKIVIKNQIAIVGPISAKLWLEWAKLATEKLEALEGAYKICLAAFQIIWTFIQKKVGSFWERQDHICKTQCTQL